MISVITIGWLLFSLERFNLERDPFRCPLRIKSAQIRIIITEPFEFHDYYYSHTTSKHKGYKLLVKIGPQGRIV